LYGSGRRLIDFDARGPNGCGRRQSAIG